MNVLFKWSTVLLYVNYVSFLFDKWCSFIRYSNYTRQFLKLFCQFIISNSFTFHALFLFSCLVLCQSIARDKRDPYVRQLLPTDKPLNRIVVKVLGASGVGKTTLIESIKCGFLRSFLRRSVTYFSGSTAAPPPPAVAQAQPTNGVGGLWLFILSIQHFTFHHISHFFTFHINFNHTSHFFTFLHISKFIISHFLFFFTL